MIENIAERKCGNNKVFYVPSISFYTVLMLHNQVMESGRWMFPWVTISYDICSLAQQRSLIVTCTSIAAAIIFQQITSFINFSSLAKSYNEKVFGRKTIFQTRLGFCTQIFLRWFFFLHCQINFLDVFSSFRRISACTL